MLLSSKSHTASDTGRKSMVILLMSVFFVYHAASQDYNYRNFNTEDGLAQSYIYSIIQDVHGYLWIGTGGGLSRYNGFVFDNYTTSDSLADNFISCSIVDGEGIWFGHMNGMLSYYNGKQFKAFNIPQQNPGPVTHFANSPDGQIWASSYSNGLMKLDINVGVEKTYAFDNNIYISTFEYLSDNELLIGTNTGLMHCRINDRDEIEIIQPVEEISGFKITSIQKMRRESGFYVATENEGIYKLTIPDNGFKANKIELKPDNEITGVQYVYEDSRSNLWIGTFGSGLAKIVFSSYGELTKIDRYDRTNGFITNNVKTVFEDREGNIWAGNYGEGLTQITPKVFFFNSLDNASSGKNIFAICITGQFRWIGTEKGLIKMDHASGRIISLYGESSGLPRDTVTSVYTVNGEELWIGTDKHGIFRMKISSDRILKYEIGSGTLENSVIAITGSGDGVWIGTKKGLCNIDLLADTIKWYTINQGGLPHNNIRGLYAGNRDILWVTTRSNTLAYIQDEKVHKIPINPVSGILTLGPIAEDKDSTIWVGSNGSGIFIMESDSIINLTVNEGLLSNYCYSLVCDANNNIWAGHKGGLSRIRAIDFSVKPVQQFENTSEGIGFNNDATFIDQQQKIFFGTDQGLLTYDPLMDDPLYVPPVLSITSIQVNNTEVEVTGQIILSPGTYKIKIDFLGISLREPDLVRYQYKLEGYDDWSDITHNKSVTYNQLTKGQYTFMLKSSSGEGITVENPITLDIYIKKPVWERWWFYFTGISLIIILIFIYIKRREHKFLSEKRILEEKVQERTREIQSQKNELELQRDIIESKNENITSSISYASNIQRAIFPPNDLIDRLLPDHFILFKPKDIVSGDFYWMTKKNNKIVFAVGDCTGHGVPGAFMSLLGITLLNEIVNIEGITSSLDIVTKLREKVVLSLKQNRKDASATDSIEIALCVFDPAQNIIQYTGGMNDLVYIRDRNLNIAKADGFSVSAISEDLSPFTMKEIAIKKGDVFYLFSDGYQDQFGGDKDKKYTKHRLYDTLLEIHKLPMERQKEFLERKHQQWIGDKIQTDDITVLGVRMRGTGR